jgi:hypothetical protein
MESELLLLMYLELDNLEKRKIIERIDSEFTRVVHGASISSVLEALTETGVPLKSVEDQIIGTYQKEMLLHRPGLKYLTTARGFDRLTYAIFEVFLENINPSHRKEKGTVITHKIGHEICEWFNLDLRSQPDYKNLPEIMEQVCKKFKDVGYYVDAHVLTKVKGAHSRKFYRYDPTKLAEGDVTYLGYEMSNAVIYPSAVQLFKEYQVSPHFSSRTIQAYLEKLGLRGEEINFNPGEHSPERVVELWEIQKYS